MAQTTDRPKKVLTLVLIHENGDLLLGMKKKGFGAGRWNGFGGKVEAGETIVEAAHRELREEAGIGVMLLEPAGTLTFAFVGDPVLLEVHVFRGSGVLGEPAESDEMKPQWFKEQEIPYGLMWKDDEHWFPYFLRGEPFDGEFTFDGEQTILDWSVTPRAGTGR